MSLRASTLLPSACSGEKYAAVPMTAPVWVRLSSVLTARAMPKSVTFTSPSGVMRMLPGLTSRCTTPWRWANARAAAVPAPIRAIWFGASFCGSRSTADSGRPSMYSITM